MQQRANLLADEADHFGLLDNLHAAQSFQRMSQPRQRRRIDRIETGVERHRDVALRRRDQVHRQTHFAETPERFGQEADFAPHADRLHRDHGDVGAARNGLDARRVTARIPADQRSGKLGLRRAAHPQRDAGVPDRPDTARVQYRPTGRCDLLRLFVTQRVQDPRAGDDPRVRTEHPGHIGPDLQTRRTELGRDIRRRRIGAATAEQHALALVIPGDKPLCQHHVPGRGQAALQRRVRFELQLAER